MKLGYNTNGFAHHRLDQALAIIAELGYTSVGITLDYLHLDPYAADHSAAVERTAARCRDLGLVPVVETGARFLLDPRRKHQPTLLSAEPSEQARRIDFLYRAIDCARALGAGVVSLWSGSPAEPGDPDRLDDRLAGALRQVCQRAERANVVIGFEPEPGMYIEDMAGYDRIRQRVDHPSFRLTLDVGHAHLTESDGAAGAVGRYLDQIVNVHLEGMRRPVHDHLPPDEGDLDVAAVARALIDGGYRGPATLELSRQSHNAVHYAARAFEFFRARGLP